jgi:hypothetical protein
MLLWLGSRGISTLDRRIVMSLKEFAVSQTDIRSEWHRQPVSTTIHIITLIVMIAGFGGLIQNLSYRSELLEKRIESTESSDREIIKSYGVHEAKIQVLESRLGGIESKMGSIDGKMDALLLGEIPIRGSKNAAKNQD